MVRTIKDTIFHCPYPILMRHVDTEITKHYYKDAYYQYKEDSLRSREELYKAHPFMMCLKYGYGNKIFTEYNISKPILANEIVSFMKKHTPYILDRMGIDYSNGMSNEDVMTAIRFNMSKIGRIFRNEKIKVVGIDKDHRSFFKEMMKDVYAHTRRNLKRALSIIYKDAIDLANSSEYNCDNLHKIQDIECYYFGTSNNYKETSHLTQTIKSLSFRSYAMQFDYYTTCNEFMDYITKSLMKVTDFLRVIVNIYFYDGLFDCVIADDFFGKMKQFEPIAYSTFLEFMTGRYIGAIAATTDTNKKILYLYNSVSKSPYAIYDDEHCKFSVVDFDFFRNMYRKSHRDMGGGCYTDSYKKIMFIIEKNKSVHFIKENFLDALSIVCTDRSNHYKSLLLKFFGGSGFIGKGVVQSRFNSSLVDRNIVLSDTMSMLLKMMQKRAILNKNKYLSRLYKWRLNINENLQVKVHVLHSDLSTIDMYNYRSMVDKDGRICFRMKIGIIFHLIDSASLSTTKHLYAIDSYFYVTVKMSDSIKNTEVTLHVDDLRDTVDDPYEMDINSEYHEDVPWIFDYTCSNDEVDSMTFVAPSKYNGYTAYYTNNAVTRYAATENILNMIAYDSSFQEVLTESYREFLSAFYDKMYYLVLAMDHLYRINHESSKGDTPIEIAYNGSIRNMIMESSYYYADGQTFGPNVSRLFDYHHMDGSIQFGDELNDSKKEENSGS